MYTVVFSWSGDFREDFEEMKEGIEDFIEEVRSRGGEVGLVAEEPREEVEPGLDVDYTVGNVEDLSKVLGSLDSRYDKVFFVTDVKAEIATANTSHAFTVGISRKGGAEELGEVGPNYIVESLEEFEKILELERMD